jgi:signal peptidase I
VVCSGLLEEVSFVTIQLQNLRNQTVAKDKIKNPFVQFIVDVIVNSVIIIIIFYIIQQFLAAPFQVIGNSMIDTLHDHEYIVVSKIEYLMHLPERGDIVVFKPPNNGKDYYVKRIVGIPGDTVALTKGKVFVNGKDISEPYLNDEMSTCIVARMSSCPNDNKAYVVPDGKYFVLGDNRAGSSDSRSWRDSDNGEAPFVGRDDIAGKARFVLLPITSIRAVPQHEINI